MDINNCGAVELFAGIIIYGVLPRAPLNAAAFRARLNVVRAGKIRTKQENSSSAYIEIPADRQNDRHRALLQRRNFRQSGQSLLAEISYIAALFTLLIILKVFMSCFASSQPRLLRVLAGPPHGAL
jgi:hypothetical protein